MHPERAVVKHYKFKPTSLRLGRLILNGQKMNAKSLLLKEFKSVVVVQQQ